MNQRSIQLGIFQAQQSIWLKVFHHAQCSSPCGFHSGGHTKYLLQIWSKIKNTFVSYCWLVVSIMEKGLLSADFIFNMSHFRSCLEQCYHFTRRKVATSFCFQHGISKESRHEWHLGHHSGTHETVKYPNEFSSKGEFPTNYIMLC